MILYIEYLLPTTWLGLIPLVDLSWAIANLSGHNALIVAIASFAAALSTRRPYRLRFLLVSLLFAALSILENRNHEWEEVSPQYHANSGVLRYVNPKIGTFGHTPNGNGGMIPSVGVPFGMTRWTAQTRENFISQCPYHDADTHIHGFQATHQPAIWMGESGQVVISPGVGQVRPAFEQRGMPFDKDTEISTPYVYEVALDASSARSHGWKLTERYAGSGPVPGGAASMPKIVREAINEQLEHSNNKYNRSSKPSRDPEPEPPFTRRLTTPGYVIKAAQTSTSHVGFLRLDFTNELPVPTPDHPYAFIQVTRQDWNGEVSIDVSNREVSGSNPQRQDYKLGPSRAPNFQGYFVSRFSEPFVSYGIARGSLIHEGVRIGAGEHLGAYVTFADDVKRVEVRTGVSFVSVDQARANLDAQIPDGKSFDSVVEDVKASWLELLGRFTIEGVNQTSPQHDQRTIFYTGLFHALQYPNDYSEPAYHSGTRSHRYYSGYTDSVYDTDDAYYQSWSIWDTYRALHSLLTLLVPTRINSMMRSLLRIYQMAGRLPMWANVVETNIMIGTHVDAIFANALERGFQDFDVMQAWEAVKKNAFAPPLRDTELIYYDRQPYTPDEVRAGMTTYSEKGWVANDRWAESASRTLDYAFDDFAAAVVAWHAGDNDTAQELLVRSQNYRHIWNNDTLFMEARKDDGAWAGREHGWTEGDDWVYTFAVMHDVDGLVKLFGSNARLKQKLDEYFDDGHNDHSNEPSHHVPYVYAAIGYPADTQKVTRRLAWENYNASSAGLSGNEDLGQMSAWYVFSALGFYPLNPASDEYVVGSPFFDKVTIRLPAGVDNGGQAANGEEHTLVISAPGASTKPYVKSLKVDGKSVDQPILRHSQIIRASNIDFEMAETPQSWGARGLGDRTVETERPYFQPRPQAILRAYRDRR